MTITLRSDKGLPLTYTELDENFRDLNERVTAISEAGVITINGLSGNVILRTSEVGEHTNLYFTNDRVDARIANLTTTSLSEGSNLYFTTARARESIVSGTGINYSSSTGTIALNANTSIVSEGTNLYYTNARVDARLAATSVKALSDVEWSGTPTTNHVLTWTGSQWEPLAAPGASGGEANEVANLGTGQGLYASKFGVTLRFYTLAGDSSIGISSPAANVITLSLKNSIATDTISSATTNSNLSLTPNGTGTVVANNLAVSSLSAGRVPYITINNVVTDSSGFLFDGTNLTVPRLTSTVTTGTAPFVVTSTTQVANLNVATAGTVTAAAQPNITSVGTLTALTVDNINISDSTITSIDTNGNIYLTPAGSGRVIAASLAVSDLTTGRVPYVDINDAIVDNPNLTFDGSTLTLAGNANITTALISNVQIYGNEIEAMNANGNLYLTPNGTGRVGVGTLTPGTLLDVNGTITSTGLTVNGSLTLGQSSANTITLTGRFGSTLLPATSATYDLGSSANKFRTAYLSGNVETSSQLVSNIATGTAPLVVTSTTQVANLNVATAGSLVNGNSNVTITANANVNISSAGTANVFVVKTSGVNVAGTLDATGVATASRFVSNVATGTAPFTVTSTTQVANLNVAAAGTATTAGTVTTAAQSNITSLGTLTALTVSGQITSTQATGTAPFVVTSTTQVANLNVATAGTVTTAVQGNITSVGTLTALDVNAQANATIFKSNVATGTAPFIVASTTQVANLNVAASGTSVTAGTVTTAAQPNITSTGTLTSLTIGAGSTTVAPITLTAGGPTTAAAAGRVEYDGSVYYSTGTTTLGRGIVPVTQYFKLTANGANVGSAIGNFFATTSGITLETSAYYELEAELFFNKNTAGTVTFTLTFSNAPISATAYYTGSPVGGGGTVGAPQTGAVFNSTATAVAMPATGSISNNVNSQYKIYAVFQANATTAGTLNIQVTNGAGTVTPLALSNYKVRRLPTANSGAFV